MRADIISWFAIVVSVIAALTGLGVIGYVLTTVSRQRRAAFRKAAIRSKSGILDTSISEEDSADDESAEVKVL